MLQKQIFLTRTEKVWVIGLAADHSFFPAAELADWYFNGLLTKIKTRGLPKALGEQTLLCSPAWTAAKHLLLSGLGPLASLDAPKARPWCQRLEETLQNINFGRPLILLPPKTPQPFVQEVRRNIKNFENLAGCELIVE